MALRQSDIIFVELGNWDGSMAAQLVLGCASTNQFANDECRRLGAAKYNGEIVEALQRISKSAGLCLRRTLGG